MSKYAFIWEVNDEVSEKRPTGLPVSVAQLLYSVSETHTASLATRAPITLIGAPLAIAAAPTGSPPMFAICTEFWMSPCDVRSPASWACVTLYPFAFMPSIAMSSGRYPMSGGEFQPIVTAVVSSGVADAVADVLGALVGAGVAAPVQAEKTTPHTTVAAISLDLIDIVRSPPPTISDTLTPTACNGMPSRSAKTLGKLARRSRGFMTQPVP